MFTPIERSLVFLAQTGATITIYAQDHAEGFIECLAAALTAEGHLTIRMASDQLPPFYLDLQKSNVQVSLEMCL